MDNKKNPKKYISKPFENRIEFPPEIINAIRESERLEKLKIKSLKEVKNEDTVHN